MKNKLKNFLIDRLGLYKPVMEHPSKYGWRLKPGHMGQYNLMCRIYDGGKELEVEGDQLFIKNGDQTIYIVPAKEADDEA